MSRLGLLAIAAMAAWISCARAATDVASRAIVGSGTANDPWIGWDTNTSWNPETEYFFKGGYYAYSVSPNFLRPGIALRGEAGTVLKFNGSGNAMTFDNPTSWTMNVRVENIIIDGSANTMHGIFMRGVRNARISHVAVRNVSGAGFWCEACVTNVLDNFRVTFPSENPNAGQTARPAYGIVLASRVVTPANPVANGGDWTTTTTIINPVIEGTSQIGIWIQKWVYGNTVINGTSESNIGRGAFVEGNLNTFLNTDFEQNGGNDLEVCGNRNRFVNILSDDRVKVTCGQANTFEGGNFIWLDIADVADFTRVDGAYLNTGGINDASKTTYKCRNQSVAEGLDKRCYTGVVQTDPLIQFGRTGRGP